jgi:hypothetical protein
MESTARDPAASADPKQFRELLRRLRRQDWVVYAKPAFGGPKKALHYLGRHTHRIANSNHRLPAFDGERVTFRYKDYARGGKQPTMTLLATEFLRRFFLHLLPKGFVRIGTSDFSRIDSPCATSRSAGHCWRAIARHPAPTRKLLPLGTALTAAPPMIGLYRLSAVELSCCAYFDAS